MHHLEDIGFSKGILREGKKGIDYLSPLFKKFFNYFKIPFFDECCNAAGQAGLPIGYKNGNLQYYNNVNNNYTPIFIGSNPIEFRVSNTSYIPNGTNSKNVTTFIGQNIDIIRNGISQSTLTDEPSYYTWNKSTGDLFIYPNAATSEIIKIKNG